MAYSNDYLPISHVLSLFNSYSGYTNYTCYLWILAVNDFTPTEVLLNETYPIYFWTKILDDSNSTYNQWVYLYRPTETSTQISKFDFYICTLNSLYLYQKFWHSILFSCIPHSLLPLFFYRFVPRDPTKLQIFTLLFSCLLSLSFGTGLLVPLFYSYLYYPVYQFILLLTLTK